MFTLEEIKNIIFDLGNKIGIDNNSKLYPMFSNSAHVFSEGPSIYIDGLEYHYIVMDRGQVRKHLESEQLDVILYEIFSSITSALARDFELEHRNKTDDSRRVWWKKQLELLSIINPKFTKIRKKEMDEILKISPFRD